MPIRVTISADQASAAYGRAFGTLKQLPGFKPFTVLRGETGIILKTWAGRTKVATQQQTDASTRIHVVRSLDLTRAPSPGDISVNTGQRSVFGRVWVRSPSRRGGGRNWRLAGRIAPTGRSFTPERYHWKDKTWVDIKEAVADVSSALRRKLPTGRRARGLARQSVLQIADALGIDLLKVKGGGTLSAAGIAKARAALATTGRGYRNGTGQQLGTQERAVITLINRLPYGPKIGMDRTLIGILAGRAKFIATAYAKGAFASMHTAARAFPYLRTKFTAN